MVECFENDHKVNSKCFICNSIIVLLRDDLNTVYNGTIMYLFRSSSIFDRYAARPGSMIQSSKGFP